MTAGRPRKTIDAATAAALYTGKWAIKQIAAHFGVSNDVVERRLKEQGLGISRHGGPRQSDSPAANLAAVVIVESGVADGGSAAPASPINHAYPVDAHRS